MGEAVCAAGGFGLFPAVVVPVLRAPDDGSSDAGVGGGVRVLRRGALGVVVRSVEGGDHRGSAGVGGGVAEERGVLAVLAALRLRDPGVPAVSGADEREGGASGALHPGRVFLWAGVRVGRGPERSGAALAGDGGQRPGPRDVEGSPAGSLRARASFVGAVGRASLFGCGRCLRNPRRSAIDAEVVVERRSLAEYGGSGSCGDDVGIAARTHQRPARGPEDAGGSGSAGRGDPEGRQRFAQWE